MSSAESCDLVSACEILRVFPWLLVAGFVLTVFISSLFIAVSVVKK